MIKDYCIQGAIAGHQTLVFKQELTLEENLPGPRVQISAQKFGSHAARPSSCCACASGASRRATRSGNRGLRGPESFCPCLNEPNCQTMNRELRPLDQNGAHWPVRAGWYLVTLFPGEGCRVPSAPHPMAWRCSRGQRPEGASSGLTCSTVSFQHVGCQSNWTLWPEV